MMYALTMFPFPPFSWSTAAEWVSELPSIMKCLLSVAREMQICADHISVGAENCSQSDQDLIISIMERESWLRNKTKMYIHYAAFTLSHWKFNSCFHCLFGSCALPLTLNISVISSSISTINDSFGILMTDHMNYCDFTNW